ncbi:MAG: twin-arginine translocase TatA/TatE family subunit [Clostridia bacterium]|nr:twin-arginine translocase TatA/TatE family subunit [Clostridia bacterium]
MFGHWGIGEILVVAVAALLLFGPRRLPEIGRALGNGLREFRDSLSGQPSRAAGGDERRPADDAAGAPSRQEGDGSPGGPAGRG